jgi:hypothetical protein
VPADFRQFTSETQADQAEFGDPSAFLNGACRSMLIAYVPE